MQYATYRPGVMATGLAVAVLLAMTTAAGADADPTAATEKKPAAQPGRWLPGDMHSHISPPDVPPKYTHAKNDLEGAIRTAREARLAWLVITPHAMDRKNEKTGRLWAADMADQLAKHGSQKARARFTWTGIAQQVLRSLGGVDLPTRHQLAAGPAGGRQREEEPWKISASS